MKKVSDYIMHVVIYVQVSLRQFSLAAVEKGRQLLDRK